MDARYRECSHPILTLINVIVQSLGAWTGVWPWSARSAGHIAEADL